MFHPLSLYIGLRYVRARSHKFFVSFITWASLVGVGVGVAALIVILSVMNGFENELRDRLLSLGAHARVTATERPATERSARESPAGASEGIPSGDDRIPSGDEPPSRSGLLSKRSARAPVTSRWPGRPEVHAPARSAACNSPPSEARHSVFCFARSVLRRNPPRPSCAWPWNPSPEARASRS
jgi:hypothetical protein